MATSVTNPIEFEFEYRLLQAERHLKSAFDDYEYETRTLCKLATERLNDNIGRGTEILVGKAGRLLALETKIADLARQYEWLNVLKQSHFDA